MTTTPQRGWRLAVAIGVIGAALLVSSEAHATLQPACNTPDNQGCSMTPVGDGEVMHGESQYGGAVPIYVILYGPWNGPINQYLPLYINYLIPSISDSSYFATLSTYFDSNGGTPATTQVTLASLTYDTAKLQGSNISGASISTEIQTYINKRYLPVDPNGIYLFLADNTVVFNTPGLGGYCSSWCGYNTTAPIAGTTLKYVFVGDPTTLFCNNCRWNFHTPNDAMGADQIGRLDGEMSTIAHEVAELITDPLEGAGGWFSGTSGVDSQSADFCAWQLGTYYSTVASGSTAYADFHSGFGDFYLQPQRVNADLGSVGYCANSYGGLFWGQNFGYSHNAPQGDWSVGNFKGQCQAGQPVAGLSESTSQHIAHSVFCDSNVNSIDYPMNACHFLPFDPGNDEAYVDPDPVGDWDSGYFKAECGENEFAAGVSQSLNGVINGLYCCSGTVGHSSCEYQTFNSRNVSPYDWDYGYYKAQCNAGQYLTGVSATSSGSPHRILCCYP